MTIFLAMAIFAASTSAPVQDLPVQDLPAQDVPSLRPSTVSLICTAAGERVSG